MNIKPPYVSVVISTYNYAQYLSEAIDSVLAQTYQDLEIIVVDDGSTDNTIHIIGPYLNNPRLHYIRKDNGGQASAKNMGIREAKGQFIAFLDADDLWVKEKLERQMPLFLNPKTGVVYSKRIVIDKNGHHQPYNQRTCYRGHILKRIFIDNFVCFSSSVVRKECFDLTGVFDEHLLMADDYDLWIRIASYYGFDYVDAPLVKYRIGHGQISDRKENRFKYSWQIMNKYLSNKGFRKIIPWWVPFYARSHTFGSMGYYYYSKGKINKSLSSYIRSVILNPFYAFSWAGIIKCLLPEILIKRLRFIKQLLISRGKPF